MSRPVQQSTDRYPTWRNVKKDLRRRNRPDWVPPVAIFLIAAVVVVSVGFVIDWAYDRQQVKRAAYVDLVEGEIEDRFNREYKETVQLEVLTRSAGRGSYQQTYVTLDGVFRTDCNLWLTDKDDPDTWTIKCADDPQPTKAVTYP